MRYGPMAPSHRERHANAGRVFLRAPEFVEIEAEPLESTIDDVLNLLARRVEEERRANQPWLIGENKRQRLIRRDTDRGDDDTDHGPLDAIAHFRDVDSAIVGDLAPHAEGDRGQRGHVHEVVGTWEGHHEIDQACHHQEDRRQPRSPPEGKTAFGQPEHRDKGCRRLEKEKERGQ
jgi:hypothetical protein